MSFIRLRALAEDYSRGLSEGSEILAGEEAEYVKPYHHLLAGLLAQRGLILVPTTRGEVVRVAPWLRATLPPASKYPCRHCGHSVFGCPHDNGLIIVGKWADAQEILAMPVPAVRTAVLA